MELPILANNPHSSASWTEMLEQVIPLWKAATASAEARESIEARVRMLQLLHGFQRAGKSIDERAAGLLALQPDDAGNQNEPARMLRAARLVSSSAQQAETKLTCELLSRIYETLTGITADGKAWRHTEAIALSASHDPAPAVLLPDLLEDALEWFSAESFGELRVVERAALVLLRILDLQPFPSHHETIALFAADFYVERAGLPPLVLFAEQFNATRWPTILESGFQMQTQPLVEFVAENLTRTIQLVLSE